MSVFRPEAEGRGRGGSEPRERRSVRDLVFWQRAMLLAGDVHRLVQSFPPVERYGMSSQLLRASVSIAANIAEGRGRFSRREFANYVSIARGSLAETETLVILARQVGYLTEAQSAPVEQQCEALYRMLTALHKKLAPRNVAGGPPTRPD